MKQILVVLLLTCSGCGNCSLMEQLFQKELSDVSLRQVECNEVEYLSTDNFHFVKRKGGPKYEIMFLKTKVASGYSIQLFGYDGFQTYSRILPLIYKFEKEEGKWPLNIAVLDKSGKTIEVLFRDQKSGINWRTIRFNFRDSIWYEQEVIKKW
jgi:hypothetical protein